MIAIRVPRIGHNILFGHATIRSDVFDTGREVVEDNLDFAESWDSFAASLVSTACETRGKAGFLSEHEGSGFVERKFVILRVLKRLEHLYVRFKKWVLRLVVNSLFLIYNLKIRAFKALNPLQSNLQNLRET